MKKIFSRIKPELLLHIVNKASDISGRIDMCPPDQALQVASFKLNLGKTFRPHRHIDKTVTHTITQESWVVIRGSVNAILYDIDDTVLDMVELYQGDCSITFFGGHNYECTSDDTIIYEFKTGPYLGIDSDKRFI